MPTRPVECVEEETAPFFSWLWRGRQGWQPDFMPLRGPGSAWSVLGWLLMPMGIWRFAREPLGFLPERTRYLGATVRRCETNLGSYGMGGPGFLGLRLERTWIVFRLWGAMGWVTLDGRRLCGSAGDAEDIAEKQAMLQSLVGTRFEGAAVSSDTLELRFSGRVLGLRRDGRDVSPFRGNGEARILAPEVDLGDVLVVTRRANLWVR